MPYAPRRKKSRVSLLDVSVQGVSRPPGADILLGLDPKKRRLRISLVIQ